MIDVKTLRIGNWVAIPECGIVAQIDVIKKNKVRVDVSNIDLDKKYSVFDVSSLAPIYLSVKSLSNFGFKKFRSDEAFLTSVNDRDFSLRRMGDSAKHYQVMWVNAKTDLIVESVHELQNVFYLFTNGTDLKIKL